MNKRKFLSIIAKSVPAAALSSSISPLSLLRQINLKSYPERGDWKPITLAWEQPVSDIMSLLSSHSDRVFVVGGAVLAMFSGRPVRTVELLAESSQFGTIKNALWEHGVIGIPQPGSKRNTVQFDSNGIRFYVECLSLESYQRRVVNNIVGSRWHFAHSSLIYSVKDQSVFDPFGLTDSQPNEATIRFVRKIREPHAAFIAVLQGMMESSVYGIPTSVEFEQMSSQILEQSAAGMNTAYIASGMLEFATDLGNLRGLDAGVAILSKNLVASSLKTELRVDAPRLAEALPNPELKKFRTLYPDGTILTAMIIASRVNNDFGVWPTIGKLYDRSQFRTARAQAFVLAENLASNAEFRTCILG